MKNRKFLAGSIWVALFFSSCGGSQQSGSQQQTEAKSFDTETLQPQKIELQSAFPATLKGQEDIEIKPRVEGFIEAVYVDEGAMVRKGQALFKINSPSSQKSLEEAQANYNTAKLDVERMRPLAEKNIISQVQLESYENALDAAKATLQQAKATMGWVKVTSPVDGMVGTITYRLGSLVNNTSVLTTVANTSKVVAYFSINEKELYDFLNQWEGKNKTEKIQKMPDVTFLLSNGTTYDQKGRIITISGVVDENTGAVNIRAAFPNPNGLLLSGTSGKVIVPKYLDKALVIPQKATFSEQDKKMVYKVVADSVVQHIVEVKETPDGQNFVVTDGLTAGDKIVTNDIINLSNGQKIKSSI